MPGFAKRKLKDVFQCELHNPRRTRLTHLPIGRTVIAIAGVTAGVQKLGVIKGIEEFCTKFQMRALGNGCVLMEGKRPILDSRPAANRARRVPKLAKLHGSVGEGVGIKVEATI